MGARFSLVRTLRSRRIAVGLIVAIIGYSAVGTMLPQYGGRVNNVAAWQSAHPALAVVTRFLDLHNAYSAPLFLVLVALLTVSTSLCAWKRTRSSMRMWRSAGSVAPREAAKLRSNPDLAIPVAGLDSAEAMNRVEAALRRRRFAVRRGPALLEANAGRAGLFGSPLFHWTVTLLLVVVALGRLTRSEGMVGVPLGGSVVDETSAVTISLSVLVSYRRVLVSVRGEGDERVLAIVVRHGRGDPLFMTRTEEAIRESLGSAPQQEGA